MENLQIAAKKINEGAKFNGMVYGKNNGKNWTTLSVYVNGEYIRLCEVQRGEVEKTKAEFMSLVAGVEIRTNSGTNEWILNDKKIYNNLNYGEMLQQYGTDFE